MLERARAFLLRVEAPERLFVLSMCLVYLMHNIWSARTILWFLVVPALLLTAPPARKLMSIVTSLVFVATVVFLVLIVATSLLGDGLPAKLLGNELRYSVAVLAFVAIVAYFASGERDFLRLLFLFLAPAAAIAAMRDIGWFTGGSLQAMLSTRLQGTQGLSVYYNSNVVGLVYAMPCVGAVAMMATRRLRAWQYALLFVSSLMLLVAVLLTGSRGSLLAAIAGIGVAVLLSANWRVIAAIAALVGIAAVGALLTPLAGGLMERRDSLRFELWPVYIHMVTLKPWLGYGLLFDTKVTLPGGEEVMNAHNIYLCAAVRGGIACAVSLVAIVLAALWSGFRAFCNTRDVTGLSLLAACLTASAVDYEIVPTDLAYLYILFWLPVAVCLGTSLAARRG